MALIRWLDDSSLFDNFFQWQRERLGQSEEQSFTPSVYPPINIYDDGEGFIARAEIPGVDPETIEVTVTGQTLSLRGRRECEESEESSDNCCYHRRERTEGEFRRAFQLPEQVDSDKVMASSKNGVLEVYLPRAAQAKQLKVAIKAG